MLADVIADTLAICAIAAPTGDEGLRGDEVARRLDALGLTSERDAVGNVLVRVGGPGRAIVVAAHLDTVFPAATALAPRREGNRLHGPGIGDNAVAVAALIELGRSLAQVKRRPTAPLILAATVGEEGLGDLRGIRHLLDHEPTRTVIAVEGHGIDSLVVAGIASARFVATYRGPGGHSWRDRERPSALHAMFAAATAAVAAAAPAHANVGVAGGGTSVNTIAPEARLEFDLRAADDATVAAAAERVQAALGAVPKGIEVEIVAAGRRPGGRLRADDPLPGQVARARLAAGLGRAREDAASTDANAAYGLGIPAVTIGLTRGAGNHRVDEWIDLEPLAGGVTALLHLVHRLAGLPAPRGLL